MGPTHISKLSYPDDLYEQIRRAQYKLKVEELERIANEALKAERDACKPRSRGES